MSLSLSIPMVVQLIAVLVCIIAATFVDAGPIRKRAPNSDWSLPGTKRQFGAGPAKTTTTTAVMTCPHSIPDDLISILDLISINDRMKQEVGDSFSRSSQLSHDDQIRYGYDILSAYEKDTDSFCKQLNQVPANVYRYVMTVSDVDLDRVRQFLIDCRELIGRDLLLTARRLPARDFTRHVADAVPDPVLRQLVVKLAMMSAIQQGQADRIVLARLEAAGLTAACPYDDFPGALRLLWHLRYDAELRPVYVRTCAKALVQSLVFTVQRGRKQRLEDQVRLVYPEADDAQIIVTTGLIRILAERVGQDPQLFAAVLARHQENLHDELQTLAIDSQRGFYGCGRLGKLLWEFYELGERLVGCAGRLWIAPSMSSMRLYARILSIARDIEKLLHNGNHFLPAELQLAVHEAGIQLRTFRSHLDTVK